MKARFKGNGVQKLSINREEISFPQGEWVPLPTIAFYKKIQSLPNLFDLVCEYNIEPFMKHEQHLRFKVRSVFCSHKPTIRSLEKMPILKRQAYLPEKKTFVYKITTYSDTYLKGFVSLSSEVNILCQRTKGGIGDIIMTFPTLEAICGKYENYVIDYACPKEYLPLLENMPFIRKAFAIDEIVDVDKYDIVYDMTRKCIQYEGKTQPNVDLNRTEIFAKQVGIDIEKLPRTKFYLSADEIHTGVFIDFKRSKQMQSLVKRDRPDNGKLVIGVCCDSSAKVRSYPYPELLVSRLSTEYPDAKILYFQKDAKLVSYKENVFAFNNLDIRDVAVLINRCDLFIGPDTGLSHIASALRIPTIWLFTHIDGRIRTRGYDTSIFLQDRPPSCPSKTPCWYLFPCDPDQSRREIMDGSPCSMSIYPNMIIEQVRTILAKPTISFVVACHNQDHITKDCIKRILKIKKFNDELIIVDNGSTDSTQNYFSKLKRVVEKLKYIRNEENLGCVLARNQALNEASGRFVWILDNDQFISEHSLDRVKRTEGDVVGVEAWKIDNDGNALNYKRCGIYNYVGAGGMFASLKVLNNIGFFDANYSPAWFEDPDLCLTATEMGYTIGYCHDSDIEHLGHATNFTQTTYNSSSCWKRSRDYFCEKWKKLTIGRPVVSIVILTHNDSDTTIRCIQSIFNNTKREDFEIIVVENGSEKKEVEKFVNYKKPNLFYIFNDSNLMVAAGRNIGAKKAKGEFILFLDNDMVVPEGWLQKLTDTMNNHNVVATAPKIIDIKQSGREVVRFVATIIEKGTIKEIDQHVLKECDFLPGGALFVRKKLFDELRFDEKFVFGVEDYDWCMRVKKAGYKLINTPDLTFLHIKTKPGRTVSPYDDAERLRKGSSFIEDSIRLFLFRYEKDLPNLWRSSGWFQWAVGKNNIKNIQGVSELLISIRDEVGKLHPDELLAERLG